MLVGEFKYIIHKHVTQAAGALQAEQTIYLYVGAVSPKTGALLSEIYESYKNSDGFLYMCYSAENTMGQ